MVLFLFLQTKNYIYITNANKISVQEPYGELKFVGFRKLRFYKNKRSYKSYKALT